MTAINRRLKELYGAHLDGGIVKRGEIQIVSLYCETLEDRLALNGEKLLQECTNLLLSVLFEPVLVNGLFRVEDVNIERQNLADIIESQLNDKMAYASRRAKEVMCDKETYGLSEYGTAEEAMAITPEMLTAAYRQLISTAKVEIFLAGPADSRDCEAQLSETFAKLNRAKIAECSTEIIREPGQPRTVEEHMPVSQAKLVMGFRAGVATPDNDVAAMQLACVVLGGSPHSKLFANVREKLSLCYYCFSHFERQKGLMMIESGIEEENYDKARNEILSQLADLQQGSFSDDELKFSALSLQNSYRELGDTLSSISAWYLGQAVAGRIRTPQEAADEVMAVTREDIVAAARKIRLDTVYLLAAEKEACRTYEL